jgi:hypothetical protein
MMLRLVLVGVVAALGVSVPSQPSCTHWFESAQAWTTSLLAEWDSWEPSDNEGPRLVGTQNSIGCEECRLARMRLAAHTREGLVAIEKPEGLGVAGRESPVTEPLSAATDASGPAVALALGIWGELYQITSEPIATAVESDEFLDEEMELPDSDRSSICSLGALSAAESAAPKSPSKPATEVRSQAATRVEPAESDGILMSCLEEECGLEGDVNDAGMAPEEIAVFDVLPLDVFATPRVTISTAAAAPLLTPAPKPAVEVVAAEPAKVEPTSELMADLPVELCGPLPEAAPFVLADLPVDLFGPVPQAPTFVLADLPVDLFGPVPQAPTFVLADLPVDLFGPAPESPDRKPLSAGQPLAGAQPQAPRLGDAVELTRRAMSAWASLLIGPALVDGSRR